jgi:ATP-dependent RNA helicase RhlE
MQNPFGFIYKSERQPDPHSDDFQHRFFRDFVFLLLPLARFYPQIARHPSISLQRNVMSFSTFGLSESIMQGVSASGYSSPTEIQKKAIPLVLSGRDIIGCAPTGTGKTAAFVLPILHALENQRVGGQHGHVPRALILTPTRELAQQIEDAIRTYGKFTDFRPTSIYGGVDIKKQFRDLKNGVDIVVATPGRLLDHLERRSIDLSHINTLVLDEADRMYDMGFIQAVRAIIAQVPQKRQTLLFSATMSREIRSLVAAIQHDPQVIVVGQECAPPDTVTHHFYSVPQPTKMDLLLHVISNEETGPMLVFSRTKHGADKISRRLERSGIKSTAIHSNRSQSQRMRALDGFKRGQYKVLVATDLAARGIDVDGITHVVNYDTPAFAEDYIHRTGRTGRAEAKGIALTFVSNDEQSYLSKIERLIGKRLDLQRYPGFTCPGRVEPEPSAAKLTPQFARKRQYYRTPRFA